MDLQTKTGICLDIGRFREWRCGTGLVGVALGDAAVDENLELSRHKGPAGREDTDDDICPRKVISQLFHVVHVPVS